MVLEIAKDWGVPPWVVEEQASIEWIERCALMRVETRKASQPPKSKGASGGRRRLM